MEWIRVTMSSAELEKKAKQYREEALSMMKKSKTLPKEEISQGAEEISQEAEELPKKIPSEEENAAADTDVSAQMQENIPADAQEPAERLPEADGEAGKRAEPKPKAEGDASHPAAEMYPEGAACDINDKPAEQNEYGIYTAEEILSSEKDSKGIREAARALEEMKQNNERAKSTGHSQGAADRPKSGAQRKNGRREQSGG